MSAPRPAPQAAFAAVWFSYFAAIGLFNPYAPLWFKELGMSTLAIGAIASLQSWTRIVAPYAWGWLGDRQGRRVEAVRWAALLALASALALWWAPWPVAVAICTALLFLANGGVVPLMEAALAQRLSHGGVLDMAGYGRVRVWGSLGFVVSVLGFGWGLERLGMPVFPAFVVLSFALLALATWGLPASAPAEVAPAPTPPLNSVMRQPAVRWFFAGVFLTVLSHTSLYAFLSLYLDELGHGKGAVGLLWGVAVGVEILFFWTQGRWFHRLSPQTWLEVAAGLSVLRFAVTAAFGADMAWLLSAQLLHAVTFAAQHAACMAMIHRHFPGALRGRGQALYSVLGYGCSGVLGGLAGGWLGSRQGFVAVFWAASAVALMAWWALRQARRAAAGATVGGELN